jgi:hypothetical protein
MIHTPIYFSPEKICGGNGTFVFGEHFACSLMNFFSSSLVGAVISICSKITFLAVNTSKICCCFFLTYKKKKKK